MRSHGLLLAIIGFLLVISFWNVYSSNIEYILTLDKFFIFLILFLGLVITVISGLMLAVGIRIMINPEFYDKLSKLIKE